MENDWCDKDRNRNIETFCQPHAFNAHMHNHSTLARQTFSGFEITGASECNDSTFDFIA